MDPPVIEMEQDGAELGQDAQWQGKNLAYIMIHNYIITENFLLGRILTGMLLIKN